MESEILIVCGPTASGKSALALELAEKSGGVIINADSQQMYAELRILTARPTPEEEARVPHRLYGSMRAEEACSAGKWLRLAKMEMDWALAAGRTPVVTGGTGLYVKALMEGIAEIPEVAPSVRVQARADLEAMGKPAFHQRLSEVDPESGVQIRPSDSQRMLRAWEVFLSSGKPLSFWQKNKQAVYARERFRVHLVSGDRGDIYRRCDARLEEMVRNGALEEVRALLQLGLPETLPAMRIIGVPQFAAHLRGDISLAEAMARAQQATRNYAKRQMTWFRHQLPG